MHCPIHLSCCTANEWQASYNHKAADDVTRVALSVHHQLYRQLPPPLGSSPNPGSPHSMLNITPFWFSLRMACTDTST